MRTIYILWLRQIKRYIRSKSRIIGSLAQPLLFLLALGYGMGAVFERAGEGNYMEFLVPGIVGMSIIFTAVFSGLDIIWDRQFGFLKETLVAPVSRLTIVTGRILGGATVATLQGLIVLFLSLFLGFHPSSWPWSLISILPMFLTALLFTALGTLIASFLNDMQGFQLIINFLIMPLFFLSGAFYPLNDLPTALKIIAKLDPLSYGIDALRILLANNGSWNLIGDLAVLVIISGIFAVIGSYSFNRIQA